MMPFEDEVTRQCRHLPIDCLEVLAYHCDSFSTAWQLSATSRAAYELRSSPSFLAKWLVAQRQQRELPLALWALPTPLLHRVMSQLITCGVDVSKCQAIRLRPCPAHAAVLPPRAVTWHLQAAAGCARPLQLAAARGDARAVSLLLASGADAQALDGYGYSALHRATSSEVVAILVAAQASVHQRAHNGSQPLHEVCSCTPSLVSVAEALLQAGADPNATCRQGGEGTTALHQAARASDPELVALLLRAGALPSPRDSDGSTPLHCVGRAVKAGANPAALQHAARDAAVVELLVSAGADANAHDTLRGWTPLHAAAWRGSVSVIQALLRAGADTSLTCLVDLRPADVAAQNGRSTLIELLGGGS